MWISKSFREVRVLVCSVDSVLASTMEEKGQVPVAFAVDYHSPVMTFSASEAVDEGLRLFYEFRHVLINREEKTMMVCPSVRSG